MADTRTVCKHGHKGWMILRPQYDKRRGTEYLCWRCRECERISNLTVSRKRRARKRAG